MFLMSYLPHLFKDKKLLGVIGLQPAFELKSRNKAYLRLCRSIMGQQLSMKVATVIYKRFLELYGGREPAAKQIANTPFDQLRGIGLSNAKANYLHNVARFALAEGMDNHILEKMDNEEAIAYLTQIKGVGRWTVEMLLMFTLGREDVFASGDGAIQGAMIRLYKLDTSDKKMCMEKMVKISQKWKPFRTYACMHLWQWKDSIPVK